MASRSSRILVVVIAALVCALPNLVRTSPAGAQSPIAVTANPIVAAAPLPVDRGASALWQSLVKLHTRASLIMVTAHPDDEDGGMLTYESRGRGVRATLLTLNRGAGGE